MTGNTDEDLMQAVRHGDLDKLNVLCQRYQSRIYNYMLKSTQEPDDSADLAQQVFIRVLKYRKSYQSAKRFELWVFQVARNVLKDHFKKMKVYRDQFALVDRLPEMVDDQTEEQLEREKRLMKAIAQLPEEKRELLVLTKFDGMKYEKVAEMRSMTVSAVKVQVHRTIKQLKTLYFETMI